MEINERKGAANRTEVVQLDTALLGQLDNGVDQHVSVRFTGVVKEYEGTQTSATEQPLNEIWNFSRPSNLSQGWTLVGIEQAALQAA